jgi:dTMP kinase
MTKGKYIVIEGPEGVGKTTQLEELARRMRAAGLAVRTLREPDSQSDLTARAIRQLTQDPRYPMNTRTEVLLYNAARSQSLQIIQQSIDNGVTCLVDRNYLTTLAIQYYGRGDVPDYNLINTIIDFAVGGTEPDLCIVLDAPVSVLKARLKNRYTGERFDNLDDSFLERVRSGYLWEAKQRDFPVIFATDSLDIVSNNIWSLVSGELANRPKSPPAPVEPPFSLKQVINNKNILPKSELDDQSTQSDINEDYVIRDKNDRPVLTKSGKEYLDQAVTDSEGNVYAFTDKLSPTTIAAAMARLSRRGDDMRIIIMDEFAGKVDKDAELLDRIITAYGDDSVQQLGGIHLVVENASNLLSKKLEWGRLGSYLEQSTRYIYFDQKDANGKYKYHTPDYFQKPIKDEYNKAMDTIFDNYSSIVRELTDYIRKNSDTPKDERDGAWQGATRAQACDAVRAVLPVATKTTIGIFASGQAIESLIMHLMSDELREARSTAKDMLAQARKVIPAYLKRADKPERGGAIVAYRANTYAAVKQLAKENLPDNHALANIDPVNLTEYWPRNELQLVADMLYEHSDLSLEDIQDSVAAWPYDKKIEVFKAYIGERLNRRHRPGRALEKAHYSWDVVCDYGIFRDLQRHRMVDDMNWQQLTPRFGYEVPQLVDEAGLSDEFEACFDISLNLYSSLQKAGYSLEAQYATLLGHKMRWKVTYNAREAFHFQELRTTPQGHPGYRKIALTMHQKLAEVHPQIAEAMRFINKDEDPKLTRLAAEKYTQFKLSAFKQPNK